MVFGSYWTWMACTHCSLWSCAQSVTYSGPVSPQGHWGHWSLLISFSEWETEGQELNKLPIVTEEGQPSHAPIDSNSEEVQRLFFKARSRAAHDLVQSNCHRQRPPTAKPHCHHHQDPKFSSTVLDYTGPSAATHNHHQQSCPLGTSSNAALNTAPL